MKRIVLLIIFIVLLSAGECDKKLFTLHIANSVNLKTILSDLVNECRLNIVLKDKKAKQLINQNIEFINVENVSFNELLNTIFAQANLFYEIKHNTVIISYNKTKTFRVDFIPSSITGNTNIDSTENTNSIKTDYTFDFWDNLKNNIIQILKNTNSEYKEPIIDKNSGLVTVTGDRYQIEEISKYIDDLNSRLHKQVLIDVKIYSVRLSSSHKAGIDWSKLSFSVGYKQDAQSPDKLAESFTQTPIRTNNIIGSQSVFSSAVFNVAGLLNFLAQNGNVYSISNPKIVTLNNQKALISAGETVYYKYAAKVTTDANGNPNTEYAIESKFVGVLLDITPQISDNRKIILSINPRINEFVDQSSVQDSDMDRPPNTKENTMMSVVRMKDNSTLILGGLITSDDSLNVNGVPILKEIPIIKYLFSSKEKITDRKELVFVITPHIVDLDKKMKLKDYGFKKLPSLKDLDVK
jgi:general secretion pathway protein D